MKTIAPVGLAFALLLARPTAVGAQEVTLDDVLDAGQQWLQENIRDDVLAALPEVDRDRLKTLLEDAQRRLEDPDVRQLAPLLQTATNALPWLDRFEETQPYAAWLRAHLDDFEVAEQFRRTTPAPPPGTAPTAPSAEFQRQAWQRQVRLRPVPKAAAPYVSKLKPIFAAENAPPELVWVAEVESGFDPQARSPVGAAGLYQLMPATGKSLGLKIAPPVDERTQPDKSARAAAKYLVYLRRQFKDWPLALAAYNAGEGNVRKLLDKSKTKTFEAIAPRLPSETQLYVPRINATLLKRENIALAALP